MLMWFLLFSMHFVKKIPTSDDEKAIKEKERSAKLKLFCTTRNKIFEKRNKGELDDEILTLTYKLLEKNPDIYTFWNIRRETIEKKITEWKDEQDRSNDDKYKVDYQQNIDSILNSELLLTQLCLEANHKSYSAWFQRGWVLRQQKTPDIKFELDLCEKALKLDCRNFHTWDHRRVVARLGNLTQEEELVFSNRLIGDNFSNYSAWHYRATLLPKIQNEKTGQLKLDDSTIADELKKVTSAFFTDPDDQSAWVYSRWLLEMGSDKHWLRPDSISTAFPLTVTFHGYNTTVVMSKPCTLDVVLNFINIVQEAQWKCFSSLCSNPQSSRIWQFLSNSPLEVQPDQTKLGEWIDISKTPYVNKDLLRKAFDITIRPASLAINTITENCHQLIKLEPTNMWAMYMYTLCLMESSPAESHNVIIKNLDKLANELDPKRKEIYKHLASRQILNSALRTKDEDGVTILDNILNGKENRLVLRNRDITSLDGIELLAGLITELDASGNKLKCLDDILLPNLEFLTVNENPIKCLSPSTVFYNLKFLSLGSCHVDEVGAILPALQEMPSLERFLYCETPLVSKTKELSAALNGVKLISHYL